MTSTHNYREPRYILLRHGKHEMWAGDQTGSGFGDYVDNCTLMRQLRDAEVHASLITVKRHGEYVFVVRVRQEDGDAMDRAMMSGEVNEPVHFLGTCSAAFNKPGHLFDQNGAVVASMQYDTHALQYVLKDWTGVPDIYLMSEGPQAAQEGESDG